MTNIGYESIEYIVKKENLYRCYLFFHLSINTVPGPLFHSGGKKAIYKEQADLRSEAGSRSDGTVTPRSILIQSPI